MCLYGIGTFWYVNMSNVTVSSGRFTDSILFFLGIFIFTCLKSYNYKKVDTKFNLNFTDQKYIS